MKTHHVARPVDQPLFLGPRRLALEGDGTGGLRSGKAVDRLALYSAEPAVHSPFSAASRKLVAKISSERRSC